MMHISIKQHLSNIWRSIHEKLSNVEAELKKKLLIKKVSISLVPLMIPPSSWYESVFNLFFVLSWNSSCFCVNGEKNEFFSSRFHGFWNCDLRTDLFGRFLWKSSVLVQKTTCVRLSKENFICSKNAPEIHIFNSWRHQKLLLVPNELQDSTYFFIWH